VQHSISLRIQTPGAFRSISVAVKTGTNAVQAVNKQFQLHHADKPSSAKWFRFGHRNYCELMEQNGYNLEPREYEINAAYTAIFIALPIMVHERKVQNAE
jgi:hypothetical protein